jgi:voltage-gated potassium channel Kch
MFLKTLISFLYDKEYRKLLATTVLVLAGGSIFYHYIENWSWVDSIYFSVITLTTVGYGDFSPDTELGKVFTIFYIIIGIGIILTFIDTLYQHYSGKRKESKKKAS